MSRHTQTRTVNCPACDGENDVEIAFGWVEAQKESWGDYGGTEPIPAHAEDVDVPEITCEWCNAAFPQAALDKIAEAFEPRDDE